MRLLYTVNARIPTEKAHGFQIMKMCESLVNAGVEVELVVPLRKNNIAQDAFSFYNIPESFKVTYLMLPDLVRFGKVAFYLHTVLFAVRTFFYARKSGADIVYSRDVMPLFLIKHLKRTVLEVHNIPDRGLWLYRLSLKGISKFVSTNVWKKNFLIKNCSLESEKILVFPNGVDLDEYSMLDDRRKILSDLDFDDSFRYVVYTGHLYEWKGAHILAAAAALLPEDVKVLFVGGTPADVILMRSQFDSDRIIFLGQQPHADVAKYLKIAEVVVLPNVPTTRESVYATSPMKLFEYMAAQRPVVASDLPSIREVVGENRAVLVKPGDAKSLANGINLILNDKEYAQKIAVNAFIHVQKYAWAERAQKIVDFIS